MSRSALTMGLGAMCVLVVACSGGSATAPTRGPNVPPVQQHPPVRPEPVRPEPPRIPPQGTPAASASTGLPAPWSWILPGPIPAATAAPIPGNEFRDAGVNPFMDPAHDPFSTFAMDVDTASYGVARRFLEEGRLPERDSVRLEEYVNSFDYDYAPPTDGAFAVHVEGAPAPFVGSRAILLRVGIQAREVDIEARPPVSLTFVIDTSGSMQQDNRLELVKASLGLLVSRLTAQDSIAIVAFGSGASIVLPPTSAAEPEAILTAIGSLTTSGSTNAQAGLELGYDLATFAHRPGALDRVILASDGVANVGLTDASSILGRIDREVEAGVELVTIGVGLGNFNDVLLEQLANRGNGFYAYVNDRTEADRVFGLELTGTLFTVARDAKIQVEFRPDAVGRYRLLGYENRALADEDFRNPYVDAGEVGAGHSVTALYEIEPAWTSSGLLGTIRLRWLDPETGAEQQLIRDIELSSLGRDFQVASPSFRLSATVAAFAEILRESPYVNGYTLNDVAREAASLAGVIVGRDDVGQFSQLAQLAARIRGW